MSVDPLVSVIIPAYQAEKTLGAAISGALTQTYPHVEIIVCNDGSTDGTEAVAAGYGDRVRLLNQANAGVSAARNAALAVAEGELCAFLDADDLWFPQYLASAVRTWQAAGGGRRIVTCSAYFLTEYGLAPRRRVLTETVPPDRQRMRLLEGPFSSLFAVFPRALFTELGDFDSSLRSAEDYDLWLRAVFHEWRIVFQMQPQCFYRRAGGSLSTDIPQLQRDERTVFRKLLDDDTVTLSAAERARIEERLAHEPPSAYIGRGEAALRAGDTRRASQEFAVAAGLLPSNRRLRGKALLLRAPFTGPTLAALQKRRHQET